MSTIEDLATAIDRAIDDCPIDEVVSVITGAFVSMLIGIVRHKGGNPDQQIDIDGGENRNITIHPTKIKEPA